MKDKIASNMGFNLLGYALFAVSGILLNVIIGIYYSPAVLGVFNTVFAIYILLSQVCVWGQNFAILSFTSNAADCKVQARYLINSLAIALAVSVLTSVIFFIVTPLFGIIFQSPDVVPGLRIAVIALPAFAMNKVLLGYLNGATRLKEFAIFRTLRMVLIAAVLFIISLNGIDARLIPVVFPVAEYIVLVLLLIVVRKQLSLKHYDMAIVKKLFKFGLHSMPIGLIAEVNTRVDVLCLNIFVTDAAVGLYSFALMFAEGLYQIYIAIRQVVNPYIAKYRQQHGYVYKSFFKKKLVLLNYSAGLLGGVIAWLVYGWIVSNYFVEYSASAIIFQIFLVGIVANSYFIIFSNYFVQCKRPLVESKISVITVLSNATLNIVLIAMFGLAGAAVATVISYCVASGMQIYYATKNKL